MIDNHNLSVTSGKLLKDLIYHARDNVFFEELSNTLIIEGFSLFSMYMSHYFVVDHLCNALRQRRVPIFFNNYVNYFESDFKMLDASRPLRGARKFKHCACQQCCAYKGYKVSRAYEVHVAMTSPYSFEKIVSFTKTNLNKQFTPMSYIYSKCSTYESFRTVDPLKGSLNETRARAAQGYKYIPTWYGITRVKAFSKMHEFVSHKDLSKDKIFCYHKEYNYTRAKRTLLKLESTLKFFESTQYSRANLFSSDLLPVKAKLVLPANFFIEK